MSINAEIQNAYFHVFEIVHFLSDFESVAMIFFLTIKR
jgi:hypothetical protein